MNDVDKNESFDLLAREKKISELYQNGKQDREELPSTQIDANIIAMAKQQLSNNPHFMTEKQTATEEPPKTAETNKRTQKSWQWPFSLVASVGLLGVLVLTQEDYFINPSDIPAGVAEPVMKAPNFSEVEAISKKFATIESRKIAASTQKAEMQSSNEFKAAARKRMLVNQAPKMYMDDIGDNTNLAGSFMQTTSMSLSDMSTLAERLKLELSNPNMAGEEASSLILNMQQALFNNLLFYKQRHEKFEITDKYLSVLSEKQVQKLKSLATNPVSEN